MSLADTIIRTFRDHADPEQAVEMSAYMKDNFPFFGIPMPLRTALTKACLLEHGKPSSFRTEVAKLWAVPQRECHYVACALLIKYAKQLKPADLPVIESMITSNSWWDTVDMLSSKIAAAIVRTDPGLRTSIASKWIEDDNFWLQRSAILLQLHYKLDTDPELLFQCIMRRADSTEFFIRKGAGWALREYSKTDPKIVRTFIDAHYDELSGLTVREGSRYC